MSQPEGDVPPRRPIWADRTQRPRRRPSTANLAAALRPGLIGLVLGMVGGLAVFFVGSSRGLDAPGLETIAIVVGGLALIVALVVSLGRAAFWSLQGVVAVALFLLGAIAAHGNGLRIVPGTTTDGTVVATVPGDLATKDADFTSGRAACRWANRAVAAVSTRGGFTWTLTEQATMTADVTAGAAVATVTSRVDGKTRTLDGTVGGLEASGARGVVTFPDGAVVRWTCPELP